MNAEVLEGVFCKLTTISSLERLWVLPEKQKANLMDTDFKNCSVCNINILLFCLQSSRDRDWRMVITPELMGFFFFLPENC